MSPSNALTSRAALALLALTFVVAAVAVPASAKEQSGSEKVDPGSWASLEIPFHDGPKMEVTYEVVVREGPNLDLLFVDNANHQKYEDGESFQYVSSRSVLDTGSAEQTFTLGTHDTWYLILDHTNRPENGADPATVDPESITVDWTLRTQVDVERSLEDQIERIPLGGPATAAMALLVAGLGCAIRPR